MDHTTYNLQPIKLLRWGCGLYRVVTKINRRYKFVSFVVSFTGTSAYIAQKVSISLLLPQGKLPPPPLGLDSALISHTTWGRIWVLMLLVIRALYSLSLLLWDGLRSCCWVT